MSELPFAPLPADPGATVIPQSTLTAIAVSNIELGIITAERSVQTSIGASEVGRACARRLAYRLNRTPPVNIGDPMRLAVGTGIHLVNENIFRRLDQGQGRFLVEAPCRYRDIPGSADLIDRWLGAVYDWKSCSKTKLAKFQKGDIPPEYRVQIQIYAAGLAEAGHDIRQLAVTFLPYDGSLSSAWSWEAKPDRSVADAAIDRLDGLRGMAPADVPATPDRLCPYCAHYSPRATDLNLGCPGTKGT